MTTHMPPVVADASVRYVEHGRDGSVRVSATLHLADGACEAVTMTGRQWQALRDALRGGTASLTERTLR